MAKDFDTDRLEILRQSIAADTASGLYYGAVVRVTRGGRTAVEEAFGHADAGRARPLSLDSVFSIFSVTKAFTNILVLRACERGQLSLTRKISEVIPEFGNGLRGEIRLFDLLTHSSGLPMIFTPKPGMYIDKFDDVFRAIIETVQSVEPAGERVAYSPMANHVLMGEALRRTDPKGRSYREIVHEDLFGPLKMENSSIGLRADLRPRHVKPDFRGNFPIEHPGSSNLGPNGAFEEEHAEMPWVGAACTVPDLSRFAEMLRRGGELDGARILSPATIELAKRNWTGDKPNELYKTLAHKRGWIPSPAYIGLGFSLRGTAVCNHMFGTLTSPDTFGNYGAGSSLYWVDPQRDISFTFLSAGVMESNDNIERFQRISDLVTSAAV